MSQFMGAFKGQEWEWGWGGCWGSSFPEDKYENPSTKIIKGCFQREEAATGSTGLCYQTLRLLKPS